MLDKIPGEDKFTDEDNILVTGGTGLFGFAVKEIVRTHKIKGTWIFLSSKEADLRIYKVFIFFIK
jgi:hypothetical protein